MTLDLLHFVEDEFGKHLRRQSIKRALAVVSPTDFRNPFGQPLFQEFDCFVDGRLELFHIVEGFACDVPSMWYSVTDRITG